MRNREDRINVLKAAGIDTSKFMAMDVPEGATIIIAAPKCNIEECDNSDNTDDILSKVKDIGYIKEDPAFRRWVMAQTFNILYSGSSVSDYVKEWKNGYMYQFDQTLEELRSIAKINNRTTRAIRQMFFSNDVVVGLCEDYMVKLHNYINSLPTHNHIYKEYKKVRGTGVGVYVNEIKSKIYDPLNKSINKMKKLNSGEDSDPKRFAELFEEFRKKMVKLDYNTKLYDGWVEAYKGAGAYYTLMGLIKFHDCRIYDGDRLSLDDSIKAVNDKAKEIVSDTSETKKWYLLYGMMKETIVDNDFDFKTKMRDIYGE